MLQSKHYSIETSIATTVHVDGEGLGLTTADQPITCKIHHKTWKLTEVATR